MPDGKAFLDPVAVASGPFQDGMDTLPNQGKDPIRNVLGDIAPVLPAQFRYPWRQDQRGYGVIGIPRIVGIVPNRFN
jgi:hypothetical protein